MTSLSEYADQMAADRQKAGETDVEVAALVQMTKQEIVANASKALVAQATLTRDGVQALLEVA